MLEFLRDLLAHAEWADAVLFHVWGKSPARDHEELRRRTGHIIGVQGAFLTLLRGQSPGAPPEGPPPFYDDLLARFQKTHKQFQAHLQKLDAPALERTIHVPWFPKPDCVVSTSQAIVQVAMHSQHHRGQCMTRLKDFGGEPKNVDWIIWLWKEKPAGRWT